MFGFGAVRTGSRNLVTVSVTWPAARAARVEIGQGLGVGLYELGCSPQLRRPLPLFSSRIVLYIFLSIMFDLRP